MIRVSKPSIGPDCHWSSPFPCGTPSTTSIMTTVRARFFSASRCAAVAPTLPAPTTATFPSIDSSLSLGDECRYRAWTTQCIGEGRLFKVRDAGPSGAPQSLVEHDPDRGGEVEAAEAAPHWNAEAALRMLLEDARRHPVGLVAEDQAAGGGVRGVPVASARV